MVQLGSYPSASRGTQGRVLHGAGGAPGHGAWQRQERRVGGKCRFRTVANGMVCPMSCCVPTYLYHPRGLQKSGRSRSLVADSSGFSTAQWKYDDLKVRTQFVRE